MGRRQERLEVPGHYSRPALENARQLGLVRSRLRPTNERSRQHHGKEGNQDQQAARSGNRDGDMNACAGAGDEHVLSEGWHCLLESHQLVTGNDDRRQHARNSLPVQDARRMLVRHVASRIHGPQPVLSRCPAYWTYPRFRPSLRGIRIEAKYKGTKDAVRATAVWATKVAHESRTRTEEAVLADDPWKKMGPYGPVVAGIGFHNGTGLRDPHPARGLVNVIVEAWQPLPVGILSVPRVKFALGRRGENNRWERSDGAFALVGSAKITMPDRLDDVNDDNPEVADEYTLESQGLMFVYDTPGLNPLPGDPVAEFAQRKNFEEFMRVRIGGNPPSAPSGGGIVGRRASHKFYWHSFSQAKKVGGVWSRTAAYNDIGAGTDYESIPTPG